jgi:hypothetical protein
MKIILHECSGNTIAEQAAVATKLLRDNPGSDLLIPPGIYDLLRRKRNCSSERSWTDGRTHATGNF